MRVLITLAPPQSAWSPGHAEIGPLSTTTDASGLWSVHLERTDQLSPAAAWLYRIVESLQGAAGSFLRTYSIAVPGAGPYTVDQVWVPAAGAPPLPASEEGLYDSSQYDAARYG